MRSLECLAGQKFPPPDPGQRPQVEIVVPVRDEERDLGPGIRRLAAYLSERFAFRAVVTIADNGSTDGTWAAAGRRAGAGDPGAGPPGRAGSAARPGPGTGCWPPWPSRSR